MHLLSPSSYTTAADSDTPQQPRQQAQLPVPQPGQQVHQPVPQPGQQVQQPVPQSGQQVRRPVPQPGQQRTTTSAAYSSTVFSTDY